MKHLCLHLRLRYVLLLGLSILVLNNSYAQQKYTISGYIEDASSGEKLIGANVYDARTLSGTTTNAYGFFSLTLPSDSVALTASFIGYQPFTKNLLLDTDLEQSISLSSNVLLEAFEVKASEKIEKIQERSQMSSVSIPINQIKSMPVLLGEVDVLKALQLLPGVQGGTEGSSGLYVRGGGPDQNLVLLDGVPVYNVSHLFGFFSVFNADALNHVELVKGGFPARYGGRLSSVVDIRMKEGDMKKLTGSFSIGLISSKFTLEGPIVKDKTSFIVSGRRTYIDLLLRPIIKAQGDGEYGGYFFYDLNAKINHRFSDKDRLYLSAYTGDDDFYFRYNENINNRNESFKGDIGWGNITAVLRWNHLFSQKLFSNATLTYSRYRLQTTSEYEDIFPDGNRDYSLAKYFSGIRDWSGKIDFDYIPSPNHYIKFGVGAIQHLFKPTANEYKTEEEGISALDTLINDSFINAVELSAYIEDDVKIGARLKANIGVHAASFLVGDKSYFSVQPRISARFLLHPDWSLKASYANMTQYIHLLTNSSALSLPSDIWVPVTEKVKPQTSQQIAAGVAHSLNDNFEISVEGYYKTMKNLISYKEGANYGGGFQGWEDKVDSGEGEAYGVEFLVQKKAGKTTGFLGYTLAWSNRQFKDINFGEPFPYKFDRRHDIAISIAHRLSKRVELSGNWVYGTGNAVSLPLAEYVTEPHPGHDLFGNIYGGSVQYYGNRNSFRMASYHRLDLGVSFIKKKKRGERRWNFGAYNAYNRKNPFFMFSTTDNQGNKVFKQATIFPVLPSISYSRTY